MLLVHQPSQIAGDFQRAAADEQAIDDHVVVCAAADRDVSASKVSVSFRRRPQLNEFSRGIEYQRLFITAAVYDLDRSAFRAKGLKASLIVVKLTPCSVASLK